MDTEDITRQKQTRGLLGVIISVVFPLGSAAMAAAGEISRSTCGVISAVAFLVAFALILRS